VGKAGLGTVLLKNQSGKFVVPTARSISAAASVLDPPTLPDERLSPVYAPGDQSYPLVNYEYEIVSAARSDPAMADAIGHFLLWSIAIDAATRRNTWMRSGLFRCPTSSRR
jgi:phosphate transport system substrate-binding protein